MGKFSAVHQFHSGTSVGDAITNELLELRRVLRRAGLASEIFAEHVGSGLEGEIRPLGEYHGDARALLVVHHSMGFDGFDRICDLPDRKILRYHNITPPHFFAHPHLRSYAAKGRLQLREYRRCVEFACGVSEYNRRELVRVGYKYTGVLPICFNCEAFRAIPADPAVLRAAHGRRTLLFVGRVTRNKCQVDLVRIAARARRSDPSLRLVLVGSTENSDGYVDEIRDEIRARDMDDAVVLAGRVDQSTLAAYYRSSHVFVCVSEHEGFGVPLLEAMASDLPIVAFRAAAVPDTLGDSGILLDDKDPSHWADVIGTLGGDNELRDRLIAAQRRRLVDFSVERTGAYLLELVDTLARAPQRLDNTRPTLQIQGPFETSYSLAAINRHLAEALDGEGTFDVSIYCTEGPGDYTPEASALADKPHAAWLWRKSALLGTPPDVVIRNLYPPRVSDSSGRANYLHFYWEDSRLPAEWVGAFNRSLDGILAPSRHVERVLRASGVTVPIHVLAPGGGEPPVIAPAPPPPDCLTRSFRFLNIGSGFPRKGIDVLLAAYFTEFSGADDVCLILKTFPNVHNSVAAQVAEWRARTHDPPACVHVDRDLTPAELEGLYAAAHCLVYPSRAEGFGLPISEAMARGIPVIATAYGGQMDFCSDANAWLIGYRLVPSLSHVAVAGAEWAEPDVDELRGRMRALASGRDADAVRRKVDAARRTVAALHWSATAQRCAAIVKQRVQRRSVRDGLRLGMVTSWNSRCGIAEYSRYLLEALLRVAPGVQPMVLSSADEGLNGTLPAPSYHCWDPPPLGALGMVPSYLEALDVDIVHFQHNFGFFAFNEFAALLEALADARRKVVVTLHRTADLMHNGELMTLRSIAPALRRADALLVHSEADVARLQAFGLGNRTRLLPHGSVLAPPLEPSLRTAWGLRFDPVIATFGFLLPHKGLLELLSAIAELRVRHPSIGLLAQCALHRDGASHQYEATVRDHIEALGLRDRVLLSTQFLDPDEATLFLQLADVLVLPYQDTAESASGAVRFALATGRPVLATASEIFADVAAAVHPIAACEPGAIATAIDAVLADPGLSGRLVTQAERYTRATSWDRIAELYGELLDEL
jgi:glycosyltransferase involved in cell wall biosynthesis